MAADFAFNEFDVFPGGFGEVLPGPDIGDIAFPAVDVFNDGFGFGQQRGEGEAVSLLASEFIADADGDFVHVAEDIQFGQGDIGSGLALNAVPGSHKVNGSNAPGPAGFRAVLIAGLPEQFRLFAEPFAGKGTLDRKSVV